MRLRVILNLLILNNVMYVGLCRLYVGFDLTFSLYSSGLRRILCRHVGLNTIFQKNKIETD